MIWQKAVIYVISNVLRVTMIDVYFYAAYFSRSFLYLLKKTVYVFCQFKMRLQVESEFNIRRILRFITHNALFKFHRR